MKRPVRGYVLLSLLQTEDSNRRSLRLGNVVRDCVYVYDSVAYQSLAGFVDVYLRFFIRPIRGILVLGVLFLASPLRFIFSSSLRR